MAESTTAQEVNKAVNTDVTTQKEMLPDPRRQETIAILTAALANEDPSPVARAALRDIAHLA